MKVWVDATVPPPSSDWKWARTSQEGTPWFLTKKVEEASFSLNFGDNSAMNGITFIRWLYSQAKAGLIPRFRWAVRGGIHWADVQKAPIILQQADFEWSKQEQTARSNP